MLTAPQLFAAARGIVSVPGSKRCFYCAGRCDESHLSKDHVKDSFTSRDTVAGGDYVCSGCIEAINEKATITLAGGEIRHGQKVRGYSWIVGAKIDGTIGAIAATKAHREFISSVCLRPPLAPFFICLSDSGQKHLIYRTPVCHSREFVRLTLEGELVEYTPDQLQERMLLCRKLIAATGKPALKEPITAHFAMNVIRHHADESLIHAWQELREAPLSRLAAWLSPAKEDCLREFPSCESIANAQH